MTNILQNHADADRADLEATKDELEATRTRERKLEADIAEMFRARARNAGV
jgi:hypothetical protein